MTTDKRNKTGEEMKQEVLNKISEFSEPHKQIAARMHELFMEANPALMPRLWYGMPGYAKSKDSAVLVFFREDDYMTFGLTEAAHFNVPNAGDSQLMPSAWFFTNLTPETEKSIVTIVRNATT